MLETLDRTHLHIDPEVLARDFDRVPFGFDHDLHGLDMLGFASLRALAEKYRRDYFVASGSGTPDARFYSVAHGMRTPSEALDQLDANSERVLLKRPELYDVRFADLLRTLFKQVVELRGGLRGERVVRLESSILISSAAAVTPFHFDPEITFFFHIEGEKIYHLYAPTAVSEPELERFYNMGIVSIGQVDLTAREAHNAHVFRLVAGKGLHQPQNSPHWVETRATRTISYAFAFETDASRARGRTRAFNHYQRRLGLSPLPPGLHPTLDARKAATMQFLIPLRKRAANAVRGLINR